MKEASQWMDYEQQCESTRIRASEVNWKVEEEYIYSVLSGARSACTGVRLKGSRRI